MASEFKPWASWLSEIYPDWLEDLGYPYAGVGDLTDLKVFLDVGNNGKWIGFVHPGWYYHNDIEQYHYVIPGTVSVSSASGTGSTTASVSFRPSWGPVLIHSTAPTTSGFLYRQHSNSFYPNYTFSWSSIGSGLYSASVPASALLVGMRDLTNLPLGAVAATGYLISERLYYYDPDTNVVTVKAATTPAVWGDLVYTYPLLRMRELVVQEADGVKASYSNINNVIAIRGANQETIVSGFSSGSPYLSHSLDVEVGDWVVLDYYISKSYILLDHNLLHYYVGGSIDSDDLQISYETSLPDALPEITVNSNTVPFNLNPIHSDSYRAGYLFHATPASGINNYWVPTNLTLDSDKTEICSDWNETCFVTFLLEGQNNLPIPEYPLSVTVTNGTVVQQFPNTGNTDKRGEIKLLITANPGASTVTVSGTAAGITRAISVSSTSASSMINATRWNDGFVHLIVTDRIGPFGGILCYLSCNQLDGIPRGSLQSYSPQSGEFNNVQVVSKNSSEFSRDNSNRYVRLLRLSTSLGITGTAGTTLRNAPNPMGIYEFEYFPQPDDEIYAENYGAQSIIRRVG